MNLVDVPLKPLKICRLEVIFIPDVERGNGSACVVGTDHFLWDASFQEIFLSVFRQGKGLHK
jgi:hypothetical protein